jgi:hypothetical protein
MIALSAFGCAAVHSPTTSATPTVTEYYGHFTKQEINEITQFIRTHDSHPILSMTRRSDGTFEVEAGERDGSYEQGRVYYIKKHKRRWKVIRVSAFVT